MLFGAAIESDPVVLKSHMAVSRSYIDGPANQGFSVAGLDDPQRRLPPQYMRPVRREGRTSVNHDTDERR
jgi:hypothetical protein